LPSFLDLGCGSGILAIAASRLWPAAAGFAIDNDPEATACTDENLARNRVSEVKTLTGTLDAGHVARALGTRRFDVVMANIQADVLTEIAPLLDGRLARHGQVVLSGLLVGDVDPLVARVAELGWSLDARLDQDEWAGLLFSGRGS
jgi:ribosomal protein L11 methyltransferase